MKILFFCPRWGQENLEWDVFLKKVRDAGYDGVEASLPAEHAAKQAIISSLQSYDLKLIGQHYETVTPDFEEHCIEFAARLRNLTSAGPMFVNSQTGKDYYSEEYNLKLISIAADIEKETGVKIIHETHRGKFSFAAHIAKGYLERLPDIRITLDISHWCNTAESFLHDQQEAVMLAISRTDHIHSRVGYTQGPQISDPRAPEWHDAVQFHLSCWDKVVEQSIKEKRDFITITSEFGAPPYLPLLPYTKQPLADQWEINYYMMTLLRNRYEQLEKPILNTGT